MIPWWRWVLECWDLILWALGLLLFLVGCLVFVLRNAQSHYCIAQSCEQEGDLRRALRHYRLAARYGAGRFEGRAAQERVDALSRRLSE